MSARKLSPTQREVLLAIPESRVRRDRCSPTWRLRLNEDWRPVSSTVDALRVRGLVQRPGSSVLLLELTEDGRKMVAELLGDTAEADAPTAEAS